MKNLCIAFVLLSICLASCNSKNEIPSRKVLDKIAKADSVSERVSPDDICLVKSAFDSTIAPNRVGMDLRTDEQIEIANLPQYKDFLSVYECRTVNDSIIMIEEYNPIFEKTSKENSAGIWNSCRKYVFHKNGDIEIKTGNMISDEYDTSDDGVLKSVYIDGKTGLIVKYWCKGGVGVDDYYYISKDGEINVGRDYGYANTSPYPAVNMFNLLEQDISAVLTAYSKSIK